MAKQRRPAQKLPKRTTEAPALPRPAPPTSVAAPESDDPRKRSTYIEAVALYERGLEALQRHAYQQAASLLESVLQQYPEERELHERVRLYLNICRRQATQRLRHPRCL